MPARRVIWVADTCHSGGAIFAREEQVALEDGKNGLFTLMLARGLKTTGGKTTMYSLYKDYLESQVPARSRELDPGYSQQPSFARAGRGDAISF